MEIDYSGIKQENPVNLAEKTWRPPRHVFFGRRNTDTGEMETEPIYQYQPYPAIRYKKESNGKIVAKSVANAKDDLALGEGWKSSPADFGMVTAPSFNELSEGNVKAKV